MIPEFVETNKKQFSKKKKKKKKKSTRLKTQEGNLGEKRWNKGKKEKEKVTRVEVIELCHKVNLLKIKQSKFEMICGHFSSSEKVKYPLLPCWAKKKILLNCSHTRVIIVIVLEVSLRCTQKALSDQMKKIQWKQSQKAKVITKWWQMKRNWNKIWKKQSLKKVLRNSCCNT